MYPSDGIHRRWENGYRITSMAATADQAAFILSIPKRKMVDETQETLRTTAFPSTHVKVGFFSFEQRFGSFCFVSIYIGPESFWLNFFFRTNGRRICTLHQYAMAGQCADTHLSIMWKAKNKWSEPQGRHNTNQRRKT